MRTLHRFNDEQTRPGGSDGGIGSGNLAQLRADGDRLLAAGDEAIRRALSGNNSEDFLRASRQQGGQ
jgi:hypothetical protein